MAHAIHHAPAPAYPKPASEVITSREVSWGAVLLLAWLGWPVARDFIVWILLRIYDLYVTYVH